MDIREILQKCDHTLLRPDATWEDIKQLCDEGMQYHTASVCIPPYFVKQAKDYVGEQLTICTVVGFPNGYCDSSIKGLEAELALQDGAKEVDMVINVGALKAGDFKTVEREISAIASACHYHDAILKVIIETCLLTKEEIIKMCEIVTKTGADYIKTSTGFSTAGATFDNVELMVANVGPDVKVKAAGGISSLEDAERFISLGADRLGTSKIVKIAKQLGI